MKIYKKNTLVYKVRAWVIVCTGSIQTLNYIALGLKTRGENIFRSMCILACFTCLFTISEMNSKKVKEMRRLQKYHYTWYQLGILDTAFHLFGL